MSHYSIVIFILFTLYVQCLRCAECPAEREHDLNLEAKLHNDLTCYYNDSYYRPVKDHKSTINVKVRFALKYISFDAQEETVTVHSWLAITWKDEYLTWTPSDYGNIKEIQIESHEIWTPRMALFNADALAYNPDSFYTTCLVANDGTVTCVPHLAHSGICRTVLRNWPYDVQNCTLYFGSWMHTGEQVNFTFYNQNPVVLTDYQDGPGWKLIKVFHERLPGKYSSSPNSTYPMLKYTFKLNREAAGPAAIVVVPSVVIVLLTLSSFLLDIKDNSRLMLVCFSQFAHFIFLTEIGYDIPKHSSDTPIILLFVRDSMIITLMAILVTLVLMALRKRTVPANTWIVVLNRLVSNGPGKYVMFKEFDRTGASPLTDSISGLNANDEKVQILTDWIQLANFLNSLVFLLSLFVYIILLCIYIPSQR